MPPNNGLVQVEAWGGGGSSSNKLILAFNPFRDGAASSVAWADRVITAGGGSSGQQGPSAGQSGAGGYSTGGDININGNPGMNPLLENRGGDGGTAPDGTVPGGAGGTGGFLDSYSVVSENFGKDGQQPGGGGGGWVARYPLLWDNDSGGGAGGSGGYSSAGPMAIPSETVFTIVVGAGSQGDGNPGGGALVFDQAAGGHGMVRISWN